MESSTPQQRKEKLRRIIRTLDRYNTTPAKISLSCPDKTKDSKLKYVRYLDPQTRAKRWMYTTWHHLPEYKNCNPVLNWSSHFVRTHVSTSGHYVIHPEWG